MPNMVTESDGRSRPEFSPVSSARPTVRYTDIGRVIARGRVYMTKTDQVIGWLFVHDDGRIWASPDTPSGGKYWAMRWVGGFRNRQEAVQFLRGARYVTSAWWAEAGREMSQAE
jgi:hypothetical protein